ncbi:MAG: OsmC family protein [Bacteroidales bacterium]|jgi:uncharacterized OsmC-like protein|nr:OsmC family protein [Bacteroidales bacterium]
MSKIETTYLGNFKTKNFHSESKKEIQTDAPTDNQGKGEYFSPTDLVVTAIVACILTISGQAAQTSGFSINGAKAVSNKIMTSETPRRIAEIQIDFDFSICNLNEKQQTIIQRISQTCPVALSLHPDIKKQFNFKF